MPKVSVIILNYNGNGITPGCLKALAAQSFQDFEVLVVDNGSCDDSLYEIKSFLKETAMAPLVRLIALNKNLGFTGGNLEGYRYARGEYIALLNNDTKPDRKWLQEIVKAMEGHAEAGICASKMITDGSNVIDSAGDGYATSLKGFKRGEGENTRRFNQCGYIFGACAGAALYRKRMIEEIGFLDNDFFLVHEDTDMNCRAQLAGWKVLYVPSAVVYHQVSSTIGSMSDIAVYYSLRNSEFVRLKNVPIGVFVKCIPGFIIGMMTEFIYFALKHKKFVLYFRAKMDFLRGISRMLEKRAVIMKNMKVDTGYLLSIMTPVWEAEFLKSKINKFLYG